MALATAELLWLQMLLQELCVPLPSPPLLWCDNSSALCLASNPIFHALPKHIEINFYFIREKVINQDIQLRHISTLDQVADIFTKGLTSSCYCSLRHKLKVYSPISLSGGVKLIEYPSISNTSVQPNNHQYSRIHASQQLSRIQDDSQSDTTATQFVIQADPHDFRGSSFSITHSSCSSCP